MLKQFNLLNLLIILILWNVIVGGGASAYLFIEYYQRNYINMSELFWASFTVAHYVNYWKFLVSTKFNVILVLAIVAPLIILLIYLAWGWLQENRNNKNPYEFESEPIFEASGKQVVKSKSKRRRKKKKVKKI